MKKAKKQISKKRAEERTLQKRLLKKRSLILGLSSIVPFSLAILFIVLYSFKTSYVWLSATATLAWLAYGGLFLYALTNKWGFVNTKGIKTRESNSVVTIYNVVLIFLLAAFFLVMTLYKIF